MNAYGVYSWFSAPRGERQHGGNIATQRLLCPISGRNSLWNAMIGHGTGKHGHTEVLLAVWDFNSNHCEQDMKFQDIPGVFWDHVLGTVHQIRRVLLEAWSKYKHFIILTFPPWNTDLETSLTSCKGKQWHTGSKDLHTSHSHMINHGMCNINKGCSILPKNFSFTTFCFFFFPARPFACLNRSSFSLLSSP